MSDRAALKSLTVTYSAALAQYSRRRTRGWLAFRSIGPVVLCSDVVIIVGVSILSGMFYHLVVFSHVGLLETSFGFGALTAVNFSAIMAARGRYKPETLSTAWKQVAETSKVWLFAFFLLSLVAFSLKVSETYSRGATLTFFAVGWLAIAGWRLLIARLVAESLADGGFAEQKTILIAEHGQLDGSNLVDELKQYGYRPVRTFEFGLTMPSTTDGSSQVFTFVE